MRLKEIANLPLWSRPDSPCQPDVLGALAQINCDVLMPEPHRLRPQPALRLAHFLPLARPTMPNPEHQAITTIWRMEGARIIAGVARLTRDIGLAEELAGDALVAALETWPGNGIPDNPGAWLMATAKNRALDHLRRQKRQAEKNDQFGRELDALGAMTMPDYFDLRAAAEENPLGDDLLRLMFIACHPLLSTEARTALTLKLIGGLTTAEISRAMLVPETTVAQRIVRAKRTLAEAHVPFELPPAAELSARLASVLEVIYLVFNEGYTATSGEHWTRPELVDEALRLGRILAGLAPEIAEVHGLVALMELQASRLAARLDAGGAPVLFDTPGVMWRQAPRRSRRLGRRFGWERRRLGVTRRRCVI